MEGEGKREGERREVAETVRAEELAETGGVK